MSSAKLSDDDAKSYDNFPRKNVKFKDLLSCKNKNLGMYHPRKKLKQRVLRKDYV